LPVPAAHYENFPVASIALPPRFRPAVRAIYAFARMADDIADEGEASPAIRLAALDRAGRSLDATIAGRPPAEPPYPELAAAITRHALPAEPFYDLMSAFRQDATTTRYPTYPAVLDYCRRSAHPIGTLLLHLYDALTPANRACSDAICTGLQLANFWQDIALDWRRGRIYIPREDMERFGVTEAHLHDARCDERWRALVAFEVARARALLVSGRPLVRALPPRTGLELALVLAGGERILDAIDAAGGDVFRRRPQLRAGDWALVAIRALVSRASSRRGTQYRP
jgi:squalene synthase HpnC